MKNIGILFGGNSTEYNVSLESAYGVITHMDHTKYLPVLIGITRQGQWLYFNGDPYGFTSAELAGITSCAAMVAGVSVLLYAVYRITRRSVCRALHIHS